jgi:hypothetical protein
MTINFYPTIGLCSNFYYVTTRTVEYLDIKNLVKALILAVFVISLLLLDFLFILDFMLLSFVISYYYFFLVEIEFLAY